MSIAAPDGSWPVIDFLPVPETKSVKNRLHLDLRADGVTTDEELQRLLELGASSVDVGQSPDVTWVVLADPEGNEFCLLSPSVPDLTAFEPFESPIEDGQEPMAGLPDDGYTPPRASRASLRSAISRRPPLVAPAHHPGMSLLPRLHVSRLGAGSAPGRCPHPGVGLKSD